MKVKSIIRTRSSKSSDEELQPVSTSKVESPSTPPVRVTRRSSRQLKLENFGYKVVKAYRGEDKPSGKRNSGESKKDKEVVKSNSSTEESSYDSIKDDVKPKQPAKRGRKPKNTSANNETEKTKEVIEKSPSTDSLESSTEDVVPKKVAKVVVEVKRKRGRPSKESLNKSTPKPAKSEPEPSAPAAPQHKDNSESIIVEKKKGRPRSTSTTKRVNKSKKESEATVKAATTSESQQKDKEPKEGLEKSHVDPGVSSENAHTSAPTVEQRKVPDEPVRTGNDEQVDLKSKARKHIESLVTGINPNEEFFTPEVVIWGDRITQTIREVSNFFIVGAKESAPRTKQETEDLKHTASLKKIINKPFTRRRAKPKSLQLMTVDEHKKILEACLHRSGDFKVGSLFHRGSSMETRRRSANKSLLSTDGESMMLESSTDPNSFSLGFENGQIVIDDVANYESVDGTSGPMRRSCSNKACTECEHQSRKRPPRISLGEDGNWEPQMDEHGKPKCTYTDLIERALAEYPQGLTVSEIYNWISNRFAFYNPSDDRWKNSVRHNLSINPYFKKGSKSKNGAGHVWTVSEECQYFRPTIKRRHSIASTLDLSHMKTDTERAVASILGQYTKACAGESNSQEDGSQGYDYCADSSQTETENESSSHIYESDAQTQELDTSGTHFSTIEMSDLNSVMHSSTCLLQLDELTQNGQLVFIRQEDEDGSNKENCEENTQIEYAVLETSTYIGVDTQDQLDQESTHEEQNGQTLYLSGLETIGSSENMQEITYNQITTVPNGGNVNGYTSSSPFSYEFFNFDSEGNTVSHG